MGRNKKKEIYSPSSLSEIQELQLKLEVQKSILLKQNLGSSDPEKIIEAAKYLKDIEKREESNIKSYLFDPYSVQQQFGYKNRNNNLSFGTLRAMGRTPIINSIISTRVEQVSAFSEPCYDGKGQGFVIQKKKSLFDKGQQKLSKEDEMKIEWITEFITNCGSPSNSFHGDTFGTFLRKTTRDSLELDQFTYEVVRNRKGNPHEFLAVDAGTIRLADSFESDEYQNEEKLAVKGYYPTYVQIYQNQVVNEYYPWELCFGVRNYVTDILLNGYGMSELENIVNIVTYMLYSDKHNGLFFSQGSAPKGIIKVSGAINEARLQEFKQAWASMVAGNSNAHKTPVMEADKMEWIDLHKNNRDMEFTKWQEYLIKIACAQYKIDPSEIGMPMQGAAGAKPLFEGDNSERLEYSKQKGLTPILKLHEHKLNKYIVKALDPNFEFKFVGVNKEDEAKELELDIKAAGSFMGYKEVRKKRNLGDLEEDDMILNQYWMANKMANKMAGDQMRMQGNEKSNEFMQKENPNDETFKKKSDPFEKALITSLEKMWDE